MMLRHYRCHHSVAMDVLPTVLRQGAPAASLRVGPMVTPQDARRRCPLAPGSGLQCGLVEEGMGFTTLEHFDDAIHRLGAATQDRGF